MKYQPVAMEKVINVENLVTVHYFQFAGGYVFSGEQHDFWELVYMDKGAAEIGADGRRFVLHERELAFHKPGEFHSIWAGGSNPPDIMVISFICHSKAMERFEGVAMAVDDGGRFQLSQIIKEARLAFTNDLSVAITELHMRKGAAAAGQMVQNHLETLLITLLRLLDTRQGRNALAAMPAARPRPMTAIGREEYQAVLADEIEGYLYNSIGEAVAIESLCRRFNMSGTSLKRLFRKHRGRGVMEQLSHIRVESAKRLIREGQLNFTQISAKCGFSSVHYFSRLFKKRQGMTPTEYSRSVRGMSEG